MGTAKPQDMGHVVQDDRVGTNGIHHGPEFHDVVAAQIMLMGREVGQGIVAPVIGEASFMEERFTDEALDG